MNTAPALLAVRFAAGLGLLAVGQLVLFDALVGAGALPAAASASRLLEVGMYAFALAGAAVVLFAVWQPPGLAWRPARPAATLWRYAAFAGPWVGLLVVYLLVVQRAGVVVPPQPGLDYVAAADFASVRTWGVVAAIVVAAPVAEEIVFRGYLQPALLTTLRPAPAIAITAAVFGAVHGLVYAVPVAALGAFFGWLTMRTASLWPAVLAHALHNTLTVVVTVAWPESLSLLYRR